MNSIKRIFITPIIQIMLTVIFVITMFLPNVRYYDDYTRSFFEAFGYDVLPLISGILIFLNTFLLLIISLISLTSKKASIVNIIGSVLPFLILFDYGFYMITAYHVTFETYIMMVPIVLMVITAIAEFTVSVFLIERNKAADKIMKASAPPAPAPAPVMNIPQAPAMNAPVYNMQTMPAAVPGKKFCYHCGNECVSQAIICPKCGCSLK